MFLSPASLQVDKKGKKTETAAIFTKEQSQSLVTSQHCHKIHTSCEETKERLLRRELLKSYTFFGN